MVRKSAMRVLVVMVLLAAASGCSLTDDAGDLPDLVVAATLELTGPDAEIGQAHQRALRLKAEQINASGVLDGRKLRVVTRDNQSDPAAAASHVNDFAADSSVVGIVGGACSQCAVDGAAAANSKQILFISLAPASRVTGASNLAADRNYVFKIGSNSTDNARAIITEIAALQTRRLGVLYPEGVYGEDATTATTNAVQGSGVNLLEDFVFSYKGDGSNLSEQAAKLVPSQGAASSKPDVVFVWATPAQAGPAADAIRKAGFTGPIYFDSAAAGSLFLANPATEGARTVFPQTLAMDNVIATTPAKTARKQWFQDYTARFGAYHGQASFAADALDLLVGAAGRAGTDRAAIRGFLESMETDGLSGPIRMTPANHSGLMPQALEAFVANGGRWRLLG